MITPQFQLAKLPFPDGDFVHAHFTLQRGSGEQLLYNGCWNLYDFVCVGGGEYLDYSQLPQPNMEAQIDPPSFMFYVMYVLLWFVVVLMNVIDIVWDVVECNVITFNLA